MYVYVLLPQTRLRPCRPRGLSSRPQTSSSRVPAAQPATDVTVTFTEVQ